MDYNQSGRGLGCELDQISMRASDRREINSAFVAVLVNGLTDEDFTYMTFPEWDS